MERLEQDLDELLRSLSDEEVVRERLSVLVSVYPFNKFEYIISHLLARGTLTLEGSLSLRNEYTDRNPYLHIFDINSPRTFGETWAQNHLKELIPVLEKPTKRLDSQYSGQYDFYFDGIRIELKASRAVDSNSVGSSVHVKLSDKALYSTILDEFSTTKTRLL